MANPITIPIKKFFALLGNLIRRIAKKMSAPDSLGQFKMGPFKGPRAFKWTIILVGLSLLGALFYIVFTKENLLKDPSLFFNTEVLPGAKGGKSSISRGTDVKLGEELSQLDKLKDESCERLFLIVKEGGRLDSDEKKTFDLCKKNMAPEMAQLLDKIQDGSLSKEAVGALLKEVGSDPVKASNAIKALNNPDVLRALRTDAALDIIRNIDAIGSMTPEEASQATKKIMETPAEYRAQAADAYREIAQVKDVAARRSLMSVMDAAKNPGDIGDVKKFAETLKTATPDEQKTLAAAFEKTPPGENRRALIEATKETLSLPEDSVARKALVRNIENIAALPADQQVAAFKKTAELARTVRGMPEGMLREALENEIQDAVNKNVGGVNSLADRMADIAVVTAKTPFTSEEQAVDAIKGMNEALNTKIKAAADLTRAGKEEYVPGVLAGRFSDDEVKKFISDAQKDKARYPVGADKDAAKRAAGSVSEEAFSEKMKLYTKEDRLVTDLIREVEAERLKGTAATDPNLQNLWKRLAEATARRDALQREVKALDEARRKAALSARSEYAKHMTSLGYTVEENALPIPERTVLDGRPQERLSDIASLPEFHGMRGILGDDDEDYSGKVGFELGEKNASGLILKDAQGRYWLVKKGASLTAGIGPDGIPLKMTTLVGPDGRPIFMGPNGALYDSQGRLIGYYRNGVLYGLDGKPLRRGPNMGLYDSQGRLIASAKNLEDFGLASILGNLPQDDRFETYFNDWNTGMGDSPSDLAARRRQNLLRVSRLDGRRGGLLGDVARDTLGRGYVQTGAAANAGQMVQATAARKFQLPGSAILPAYLYRLPAEGISSKGGSTRVFVKLLVPAMDQATGNIELPEGTVLICTTKEITIETARLAIACTSAEPGGNRTTQVDLTVGSADGSKGVLGVIEDGRGYYLLGAFMSAFTASVLDAFTSSVVAPIDSKTAKAPTDYLTYGAATGAGTIMSDIAKVQINKWQDSGVIWKGYNKMAVTVFQEISLRVDEP